MGSKLNGEGHSWRQVKECVRKWQKMAVGISGFVEAERTRRHPLYVLDLLSIWSAYTIISCFLLRSLVLGYILIWSHLLDMRERKWRWTLVRGWWIYIVLWGEVSATLAGEEELNTSAARGFGGVQGSEYVSASTPLIPSYTSGSCWLCHRLAYVEN